MKSLLKQGFNASTENLNIEIKEFKNIEAEN